MDLTLVYLCISFVLILLYLYLKYVVFNGGRMLAKIPGPKGLPIIDNTLDVVMGSDALFKYVRDMYRKYKGITKLQSFGIIKVVNIYDPNDLETILSTTKYNEKQLPYTFLRQWLCEGLLISNGAKWQQRRKLLTPAFHFSILKQFSRTFAEQTQEFLNRIQQDVGREKTHIMPLITRATLRIMCETSMGTTMTEGIQSVANKYFNAIYILGKCTVYRQVRVWLYSDWLFKLTRVYRSQTQALKDLTKFTDQIIEERRIYRQQHNISRDSIEGEDSNMKERLAMLDLLLENEKEGKIDINGIREEVSTFMFEGHDTTAMALCFMIMRIANEPIVQERICEELNRICGDSDQPATVEQLNEMKYLECCIKETLRIYPSVPVIARYLTEEVTLSGYRVPSGTAVYIHIFDIHRRGDVFPQPEKFIPERFLPENSVGRHPYSYIPFSAGPRNCIGQKFAMLEMKTVMTGLLRKFHLEPVTKPEDITFTVDLVLRTNQPIYVRFRNRQNKESSIPTTR